MKLQVGQEHGAARNPDLVARSLRIPSPSPLPASPDVASLHLLVLQLADAADSTNVEAPRRLRSIFYLGLALWMHTACIEF